MISLKTMQTPLSPYEKQQLWPQYQAQKPKNKQLDRHLKRDLQHGWLFPYLVVCQDSFEGLGTDNFGFWISDFGELFYPSFQN